MNSQMSKVQLCKKWTDYNLTIVELLVYNLSSEGSCGNPCWEKASML